MTDLEYILVVIAGILLGLLLVGMRILRTLREIKVQQVTQAADATKALVGKLDELYGVEAVMARATTLAKSACDIVNSNHSKEVVHATVLIVQATFAALIKQVTDAMVVTGQELAAAEHDYALHGTSGSKVEHCRKLLDKQELALHHMRGMQQTLLYDESVLG